MTTSQIPSFLFTVKNTGEQINVRTSYPDDVSIITYSNLISQDTWAGIAYPYDSEIITNAIKKAKIKQCLPMYPVKLGYYR